MLTDLIRAVLAAAAVGVLPGWFWARLLLASDDRAERLAYAVALSITLAPAVALVEVRLLGGGVTSAVAVTSALVVFAGGLVAYLAFGAAKGTGGPVAAPPSPPGLPALVPLAAAFALALAVNSGVLPGWWTAPVALLVFSGGVAYLLAPRPGSRQIPVWAGDDSTADRAGLVSAARRLLLPAVLLLVLLRGYLGPLVNGWPYPRGVDRYEHAVMAGMMMSEGSTESFMLYPPGFHLLTAMISRLGGIEPLQLFPFLAPALPLLPALACYALARRLWGPEYGAAAALFSGLLLGGTDMHFSEARYPNFVGEYFLIVLALAALVGVYATPSARAGLLLALVGSSTVLYHQIASYTLAVMLGLVSLFLLPYLLLKDRRKGVSLLISLSLLFVLSVLYAWDTYDLPNLVAGMLGGSETGRGGEAVAMAIGTKPVYPIGHLLDTLTPPVAWLGLLGALMAFAGMRRPDGTPDGTPAALARLTLLLWGLLLFAGSRTSYSGFPDRFERDLGVPLAVLAALALVTLLRSLLSSRASRGAVLGAAVAAAVLSLALVGTQAALNLEQAAGPSVRPKDRPAPPEVVAAGRWLGEHNTGGSIVATPYLDYVPSRGMLAMGGYTGMQSYDIGRIERARDLPPFGAGPLWDAQWVLYNPDSARTERIIRENDVRYVVFHKLYPGMPWRTFKGRDDLYETAYENDSVVIFAPREARLGRQGFSAPIPAVEGAPHPNGTWSGLPPSATFGGQERLRLGSSRSMESFEEGRDGEREDYVDDETTPTDPSPPSSGALSAPLQAYPETG